MALLRRDEKDEVEQANREIIAALKTPGADAKIHSSEGRCIAASKLPPELKITQVLR